MLNLMEFVKSAGQKLLLFIAGVPPRVLNVAPMRVSSEPSACENMHSPVSFGTLNVVPSSGMVPLLSEK